MREILAGLAGSEVGLVAGPPMLVTAAAAGDLPQPGPGPGARAGRPGGRAERAASLGLAGPRRLAGGIVAETARVRLDDGREVVVALGDLERFS